MKYKSCEIKRYNWNHPIREMKFCFVKKFDTISYILTNIKYFAKLWIQIAQKIKDLENETLKMRHDQELYRTVYVRMYFSFIFVYNFCASWIQSLANCLIKWEKIFFLCSVAQQKSHLKKKKWIRLYLKICDLENVIGLKSPDQKLSNVLDFVKYWRTHWLDWIRCYQSQHCSQCCNPH